MKRGKPKYDYSLIPIDYPNNVKLKSHDVIRIICPLHGVFSQEYYRHKQGSGCPKCVGRNCSTEDFIYKSKKIHGEKFNYSKSNYKNSKKLVIIICPDHGEFQQRPFLHISGSGCPKCSGNQKKWMLETCLVEAKKYKTISEWKSNSTSSYQASLKNGWNDICTNHMIKKKNPNWTLDACIVEAKKYKTKFEWLKSSNSYKVAYRNGWLKECCKHMK